MLIIGVTGGVGSGKSTVLKEIEKRDDCYVIRSDDTALRMEEKGGRLYVPLLRILTGLGEEKSPEEVLQEAGEEHLVLPDGALDRRKIAAKIFGDDALLAKVNGLVHPAVLEEIREKIREKEEEGTAFFFVESAIIIEAGYLSILDELWYIHADLQVRKDRLSRDRGYSEEKTAQVMESQLSEKVFREHADVCIDNSGELSSAMRQVEERLETLGGGQKRAIKKDEV